MSTVLPSSLRCDVLRCVVVCQCRCSGAEYQEIFRATQVSGAPKESRNVVFFSSPSPKRKKKKCRNFKMWLRLLAVLTVTGCFINPSAYLLETNYIQKKRLDDKFQPDESTLLNCNNLKPTGKVHFTSGAFFSSGPFVSKCQVIPSIALNY